ncbi:hypothetical protein IFM47457_05790 [Aspergillus lentulus]|nr:hypothetical protein IFM47457_05790 [Aspergillus lentulus]
MQSLPKPAAAHCHHILGPSIFPIDTTITDYFLVHGREKCSAAIKFLSTTMSASSFKELKQKLLISSQQRLLTEIRWSTGNLISLTWFALISARTFYLYTSSDADE